MEFEGDLLIYIFTRLTHITRNPRSNENDTQVRLSVETVRRKEAMSRMQRNAHAWNLWNKTRFYVLEDDVPSNQPDRVVYRNVSRRIKLTLSVAENAPPGSKVAFT